MKMDRNCSSTVNLPLNVSECACSFGNFTVVCLKSRIHLEKKTNKKKTCKINNTVITLAKISVSEKIKMTLICLFYITEQRWKEPLDAKNSLSCRTTLAPVLNERGMVLKRRLWDWKLVNGGPCPHTHHFQEPWCISYKLCRKNKGVVKSAPAGGEIRCDKYKFIQT